MVFNRVRLVDFRFNSLQTGRCFRTSDEAQKGGPRKRVSIPFKREGVSERELLSSLLQMQSFNSLQTGRCFRTAPPANPVTVRAKIAKTKRDRISEFFWAKILKNCR